MGDTVSPKYATFTAQHSLVANNWAIALEFYAVFPDRLFLMLRVFLSYFPEYRSVEVQTAYIISRRSL